VRYGAKSPQEKVARPLRRTPQLIAVI